MSKRKPAAAAPAAVEITEAAPEQILVGAVILKRSVKIAGELRRSGDILMDLSPELADEIVSEGWGDWEKVVERNADLPDEDGNPVDLSALQTDETGAGDGEGDGTGQNTETA